MVADRRLQCDSALLRKIRGDGFDLSAMSRFRDRNEDVHIDDHPSKGYHMVWSNRKDEEDRIYSKLDKVEDWSNSYQNVEAKF